MDNNFKRERRKRPIVLVLAPLAETKAEQEKKFFPDKRLLNYPDDSEWTGTNYCI